MITQTPGVYIRENSNLPASIAGVSTAIPVFIGFTEVEQVDPVYVSNLLEFTTAFGGAYSSKFKVDLGAGTVVPDRRYFLYDSYLLYLKNGGGPCYILSAGNYQTSPANYKTKLSDAIARLDSIDNATVVSIPDMHVQYDGATTIAGNLSMLSNPDFGTLAQQTLNKVGALQDKFCVFDVRNMDNGLAEVRNQMSPLPGNLKYGAVYYPWLRDSANFAVSYGSIMNPPSNVISTELDLINANLGAFNAKFPTGTTADALMAEYLVLANAVGAASTASTKKTALTAVFKFVFDAVKHLSTIEADAATNTNASPELTLRLDALKNNPDFIGQVQLLYRYIHLLKDANASNPTTVQQINLTPFTTAAGADWFNYTNASLSYTDVQNSNLLPYDVLFTDAPTNTVQKAVSQILRDFSGLQIVDFTVIFSGVAGIVQSLLFKRNLLEKQLFATSQDYSDIKTAIQNYMKQVPAQGAVTGIYCANDRDRGVWKSPANISVQGIERPMVEVSNAEQDLLNVDAATGKSINAIRTFTGKGPLVWGARTLEGNSNEWRYIGVRRFFNFAEESIKKSLNDFVFEPNNARTWVKIKAMVTSFLVRQWQEGALVGTSIDEAFFVKVGENTTTDAEINQGIVNIEIGMAVARPAEFIVIEFTHLSEL